MLMWPSVPIEVVCGNLRKRNDVLSLLTDLTVRNGTKRARSGRLLACLADYLLPHSPKRSQ